MSFVARGGFVKRLIYRIIDDLLMLVKQALTTRGERQT